jgi:hypothetical protein
MTIMVYELSEVSIETGIRATQPVTRRPAKGERCMTRTTDKDWKILLQQELGWLWERAIYAGYGVLYLYIYRSFNYKSIKFSLFKSSQCTQIVRIGWPYVYVQHVISYVRYKNYYLALYTKY